MRKVYLSIIGFSIICRLSAHAQTKPDTVVKKPVFTSYKSSSGDGSEFSPKALTIDEVNFVSSYYWQDGNHSAVTGGIGTENVNDFANGLDLKLVWVGDNLKKNTISLGFNVDHHTSASSAFVNLSGASKTGGTRIYPSFDWTTENNQKGTSFGLGAYYSGEYNYKSIGADLHFSVKTHDRNGEFSAKLQGYFDQVKLIYPSELIPKPVSTGPTQITTASGNTFLSNGEVVKPNIPSSPRNTYTAAFSYSQLINSRLQVMVLGDVVTQNGFLSLPFHRVYLSTGSAALKDTIEKLPSSRFKLPIGIRVNYFLGDNIILRSYYRYYTDSWGVNANTANLEIAYKVTPFFSISPFYRYYNQSAAKYFAPYGAHPITDQYYTSNYEYSKFRSDFYGIGFRIAPPTGVFGWQGLHDLEIRYGHYTQSTDLLSNVVSIGFGFK